jgi:peptidylprolyl isomerase
MRFSFFVTACVVLSVLACNDTADDRKNGSAGAAAKSSSTGKSEAAAKTDDSAQPTGSAFKTDGGATPAVTGTGGMPALTGDEKTTASGLKYLDLQIGSGAALERGQTAIVHAVGWLEDGTEFENTRKKNKPFEFLVGAGYTIPGWEEGVGTMKVGGRRRLFLTPELGFGRKGSTVQGVPANVSIIFEAEVISVK